MSILLTITSVEKDLATNRPRIYFEALTARGTKTATIRASALLGDSIELDFRKPKNI